jgi:RimJ/RimL family protein N-acetyltransferase
MPSFETTTLTTARLRLRALVPADAAAMFAVFSDPEVVRYWSSTPWTEMETAHQFVASAEKDWLSGAGLRFGIEVAATGQLAGQVALHHFDQGNRRCEVGYALARQHWRKGYLTEALGAVLEHGFTALQLNRVEADIDPRNVASAKPLERLGFRQEGLLRERWIVGGEICDTSFYGLLLRDWTANGSR